MTERANNPTVIHDGAASVSRDFLQSVIDAFPDALVVIDRDHRIVLSNRVSREVFGVPNPVESCLKCYEYTHRRDTPCDGDHDPCPLAQVIETKASVRVHHTHFDADGKEVAVAIDAAPVLDENGEVVQVIESCRDVTEATIARRLLRIGNRHMRIGPLLEEATATLRAFTGCSVVGIRILDENGGLSFCSHAEAQPGRPLDEEREAVECQPCHCLSTLHCDSLRELTSAEEGGVCVYRDCRVEFADSLPDEVQGQLAEACHQCGCASLALVPIVFDGHVLGLIHFACHRPSAVSPVSIEALERLATELGAAIQRVRAEEALQEARDDLEVRVQQRTEELTRTNEQLEAEIAERTRLERDMLSIAAREQHRIGQEMHDGIGQELTGLSYFAQSLHRKLQEGDTDAVELAGELAHSIPRVLTQVRRIVRGLLPLELGANDLETALELLTVKTARHTGIACRYESHDAPTVQQDEVAFQIYRIAQEAIANATRHAQPKQIVVALKGVDGALCLEIRDDGSGLPDAAESSSGAGLRTMKSRARAMDGVLQMESLAEGGTRIACILPPETYQLVSEEDDSP